MTEEEHDFNSKINKCLTIDDFRFSKIKLYSKIPKIEKEQLLVRITKTDPVYKSLFALNIST